MIRKLFMTALLAIGLAAPVTVTAAPLAKDVFGHAAGPTGGSPSAIGSYAKGCVSGAAQLPETGPTWQAMRLSRNRNWGHPELVSFLMGLSQAATKMGWRGLYIGDMSQSRGGPMLSGHASHQMGLDADIWMLKPSALNLSPSQRENISSVSITDNKGVRPSQYWSASHAALLQSAAMDPRVDRIFVDPVAKVLLCQANNNQGAWLQKIRPLNDHDYHFHVRLKCPAGSSGCETQTPTTAALSGNDNGCSQAAEWIANRISPKPAPTRPAESDYRHPRSFQLSEMPRACQIVGTAR